MRNMPILHMIMHPGFANPLILKQLCYLKTEPSFKLNILSKEIADKITHNILLMVYTFRNNIKKCYPNHLLMKS